MTTGTKRATQIQRLSAGDLKPLAALIDHLALGVHFPGDAVLYGADPVIIRRIASARHPLWLIC